VAADGEATETVFVWIAAVLIGGLVGGLLARGLAAPKPWAVGGGGLVGGVVGAVVLRLLFAGPLAAEYMLIGSVFGGLAGVWLVWSVTGGGASAPSGGGRASSHG
jgi:hypothetical protein